jgi:hypothetical protein
MATNVRPAQQAERSSSAVRRVLLTLLVGALIFGSVAAQAVGLTPVAILLLVVALVALAPLVNPATGV